MKIKNIKQKAQTDAAGIIEKRFCIRKMRIYAKILCKTGYTHYICIRKMRIYAKI